MEKTTISVDTSSMPSETKKYPKYVGRKLLFANSISLTEVFCKESLGRLLAIKKLKAVNIMGIEIKTTQDKTIGQFSSIWNEYFSFTRNTTTINHVELKAKNS